MCTKHQAALIRYGSVIGMRRQAHIVLIQGDSDMRV
mgnify:CR=1 FL=1